MKLRYWVYSVLFCLLVSGCSNTGMLVKKQTELEARLEQLIQGNAATNTRLSELSNEMKELQNQVKSNSADLAELKPVPREIKSSPEAKAPKVDEKAASKVDEKIVVVNKGTAPGDKDTSVQDAYMKAYGIYSSNNYKGAIEAFDAFIKANPTSEYAGNAQYWIGECYYSQHEFEKALAAFNKAIENYPNGKKVPDAMLKAGYSLINMNQPARAQTFLQSLVERYPKTPAAIKAQEKISQK